MNITSIAQEKETVFPKQYPAQVTWC